MGIQLSYRAENIVGEEEIARYEQFLLFPQCFQKLSVVDALKKYPWSKMLKDVLRNCKPLGKYPSNRKQLLQIRYHLSNLAM